MAKPTNAQLVAALELANARIALLESKLNVARECYVKQRTTIASLEGQLANKAAWSPSAKLRATRELAMSTGRVTKVA